MKRKTLFMCGISLLLSGAASCEPFDDNDNLFTIDPADLPMFQYGEDGVPYRWETPVLSQEMQSSLQTELVGHGWGWMQTNEIENDGRVSPKPFYENLLGISPISYYFESDSVLFSYYHSDVNNKDVYQTENYTTDLASGTISNGSKPFGRNGSDIYLRIWSIYQLSGHWYMQCVEPISTTYNEIGVPHIRWGVSQYVRLNDAELKQMQTQYSYYCK